MFLGLIWHFLYLRTLQRKIVYTLHENKVTEPLFDYFSILNKTSENRCNRFPPFLNPDYICQLILL